MSNIEQLAESIIHEKYNNDISMLQICIKCILHDSILYALSKSGMLNDLVFHGGTCLQKVYGGTRLSEDLDFNYAGNDQKKFFDMGKDFTEIVKDVVVKTHSFDVQDIEVIQPKIDNIETKGKSASWVIKIVIGQKSKSYAPKSKIKAEVSATTSINVEKRIISPFHIGSLTPPIIANVMSLEEIFVDKVIALIGRARIKFRDVYDIQFLIEKNTPFNNQLFLEKLKFHLHSQQEYLQKALIQKNILKSANAYEMYNTEISRFVAPQIAKLISHNDIAKLAISNSIKIIDDKIAIIKDSIKQTQKINDEKNNGNNI